MEALGKQTKHEFPAKKFVALRKEQKDYPAFFDKHNDIFIGQADLCAWGFQKGEGGWQGEQRWALRWIQKYVNSPQHCFVCGKRDTRRQNCSKCHVFFYCSKDCQKIHWKQGGHKLTCNHDRRYALLVVQIAQQSAHRLVTCEWSA